METKKCTECVSDIDKKARRCPHCQAKQRKQYGLKHVVIGCIFLLLFLMLLGSGEGSKVSRFVTESEATVMAQNFVKTQLKSPSTANFPLQNSRMTSITDGEYIISSYVDAQNSFGATTRTNWTVHLKYIGGNWAEQSSWELISIDLE